MVLGENLLSKNSAGKHFEQLCAVNEMPKALVTARMTRKRKFDDMSPEEQGLIHDLETGVIEKQRGAHRVASQTLVRGRLRVSPQ